LAYYPQKETSSMARPNVSIIVLSYNSKNDLKTFLSSLEKLSYPNYEVILADNASKDDSPKYVKDCFAWVKIIKNSKNLGYAEANNQAAKASNGEYLLFLNADTWVKPNLLDALVSTVTSNQKIGVSACMQLSYDGKRFLNTGLTTDLFSHPVLTNSQQSILYSDGASLFVKKSVFQQIGGFDPQYFMYGEDVDLCWRVLLAGYDVVSVPSAVIGHKSGGTLIQSGETYQISKFRRYLAERNSLRTILKNYSVHTLIFLLPICIVTMLLQGVLFFLIRQSAFAILEMRAIFWNLRMLKDTFALRNLAQKNRRLSDRAIIGRMSKAIGFARAFANMKQDSLSIKWERQ